MIGPSAQYSAGVAILGAVLPGVLMALRPGSSRTRRTLIIASLLLLGAIVPAALLWHKHGILPSRNDTGTLRSMVKSRSPFPILRQCSAGLKQVKGPSQPLLVVGDDPVFLRMQNDEAKITLTLRDPEGQVIATIRDNVWLISIPNAVADWNFSEDTLEILGRDQDVVLQVQVRGETVWVTGTTYPQTGGDWILITPHTKGCNSLDTPMFQYPRSRFWGKRSQPPGLGPGMIHYPGMIRRELAPCEGLGGC